MSRGGIVILLGNLSIPGCSVVSYYLYCAVFGLLGGAVDNANVSVENVHRDAAVCNSEVDQIRELEELLRVKTAESDELQRQNAELTLRLEEAEKLWKAELDNMTAELTETKKNCITMEKELECAKASLDNHTAVEERLKRQQRELDSLRMECKETWEKQYPARRRRAFSESG